MSVPELEKVPRHSRGRNMVILPLLSLLLQNRQLEIQYLWTVDCLSIMLYVMEGKYYEFSRRGGRHEKTSKC